MTLYNNSIALRLAHDLTVYGNLPYSALKLYPYPYESAKDAIQKLMRAGYVGVVKATNIKSLYITPAGKKAVDEALARTGEGPAEKAPVVYDPSKADRLGRINEAATLFRMAGLEDCYQTSLEFKKIMEKSPRGGDKLKYSRFLGFWEKEKDYSFVYHFGRKNVNLNKNGETNAVVAANEMYGKYPHKLILGNSTDTLMSILRYSHMLETLPAEKRKKMVNMHYHIKPRIASDSNVCFLPVIRDSARILPMMGHSLWRDYAEGVHHTFAREELAVLGLLDCRILPPLEHLLYPDRVKANRALVVCYDWQEKFVKEWYAELAERREVHVQIIETRPIADHWFGRTDRIIIPAAPYQL